MDDREIFFVQFVISEEIPHRFSGEIHIGFRFSEEYRVSVPLAFGEEGFEAMRRCESRESPCLPEEIEEEEPDIVSGVLIFFTGISETEDEDHRDILHQFLMPE